MKYALGNTNREVERLDIQASIFEKETTRTLRYAGIKFGMQCLDLGCGTGNTTLLLADLVGKSGKVFGLDINENSINICKRKAAKKRFKNVKFVTGDVYNTKFENSMFDCVFSRFLFQHLRDPQRALEEMIRVTRRGGIIAVEELDHGSWLSYPYDHNLEKLRRSYVKILKHNGSDPYIARKLYKFFLEKNLKPKVEAYSVCVPMSNKAYNMVGVFMAEVLEEKIIQNGIMSKVEFKTMLEGLRQYTRIPYGMVLYALSFRLWGNK
ncbi:MAG: methyltransferase domain-containing protein [Nitrososphaerales archaeon]